MTDVSKMSNAMVDGHQVFWTWNSHGEVVAYDSDGLGIGTFDDLSDMVNFIKAGNYSFTDDI